MAKLDELKNLLNEDETDIELENPVDDSEEEESDMEKFSAMLRQSIAEEHEAAANYTKRAAKCEKHGMEDAAKLFRDIAEEEVVHVGEFQALMEKYGLLNQDAIDQGEQEAQEILSDEKVEPEIDSEVVPTDDAENESVNETGENNMSNEDTTNLNPMGGKTNQDDKIAANMNKAWDMDKEYKYSIKSNLSGEQDLPVKKYTERSLRNIYTSYWRDEMYPENWDELDPAQQQEIEDQIRDKAWNTPIEEVIEYLNNTGEMTVTTINATNEGSNEDVFQCLIEYADNMGVNVADLKEYDSAEIAEWISDKLGLPVDAEDVENMIEDEIYDMEQLQDEDAAAGTIASAGEAPTVVAGKGVVEVEPTKICEELKALQEALKD